MNIGIDIDGVLTDIERFHFTYGVPFFDKKFNMSIVNEYGKDIVQLFQCTMEQERKFWLKHSIKYVIKDKVRPDAEDFVKWLYDNGHKVYIITSRAMATKDNVLGKLMRYFVKKWLKKSGIRYERIIFCDEDKIPALKECQIDYMIEDDPDNIRAMQGVAKLLCMNAKCNEHITEEQAHRCYSFDDVLDYMKQEIEGKQNA